MRTILTVCRICGGQWESSTTRKMVKGPIDSWGVLWDTRYQDDILMQKSVRDAFGVALKYLGYSLNTTDEAQLDEAKQKLLEQKHSGWYRHMW